jgi:putative ABC transport system ATP-binding protein
VRGLKKREARERAREFLARVGLVDKADNYPEELSGGQQQRVAIARALVNQPRLILADEPTGNLDSKTSISVMALLQELWNEGLTTIYVTHEPDIAQYASRLIVVRDGQIVADTPQTARRADTATSRAA